MIPVEMRELSEPFFECWIAAARHLTGLGNFPEMAWLKQDPHPPFLAHLSFRYGNQLFFVRAEDGRGEIEGPGSIAGLARIAQGCRGFPCKMPMIKNVDGNWHPQYPGAGLRHAITGDPIEPAKLADDRPIEMTPWEVHDLGVQIVRDSLKAEGRAIMSSQGDPEVDPSIWFNGDAGPEWVVVRTDRYPAKRAEKPANWSEVVRACSEISSRGNFASVVAAANDRGTLYRGCELSLKYQGLEPYLGEEQMPEPSDTQMAPPNVPPTHAEIHRIETAWRCLELITEAMAAEQQLELLAVKTLCWQDVREWFPPDYAMALAECRAIEGIRKGIEKKLLIGVANDTFHFSRDPGGKHKGEEAAYDLGQKLVRWNALMERRFLDRLLGRRGPLEADKLLRILRSASDAYQSWWKRYGSACE